MKYIIVASVFIILSSPLFSQSINITGKVINDKKETVEKVQITLRQTGGVRIVAFTQSSKDGSFELKKENNNIHPDSLELFFSCLGYAIKTQKIPKDNKPMLVELEVTDFKLKEVVVSPSKIRQRGDTVTYLVSSFSSDEDRTIGDVLRKMPGVEVSESGKVTYQGKDLNKFYIEGSDMLGGRYGLATNNISHKDVASVDIMENHQLVKALQDMVFSDSPAMNIKLKEDAKSRWAGTIKGGAGIPELWVAETFAMRFKAKTQSLNTYKGNNTGNESYEMSVFFPSGDFHLLQIHRCLLISTFRRRLQALLAAAARLSIKQTTSRPITCLKSEKTLIWLPNLRVHSTAANRNMFLNQLIFLGMSRFQ